jgi:hypothetical protein
MLKNSMFRITVNSTALYVTAFLFTTILHESFHALAGALLGSHPVLHHNYVEHLNNETLSTSRKIAIALAGPLVSLMQGIFAAVIFFRMKKYDLLKLFLAWFSVLGFNNFIGYVMTGPLFSAGDIGRVYDMLNTPLYVQIILAVFAAIALVKITLMMSRPFLGFAFHWEWLQDGQSRKKFLFHIIILPWIIGSFIMTGLYLPVIAIISIIYPVMSGFVFIGPWQNGRRITDVVVADSPGTGKISFLYISILVTLSLVFKFVLQPGIAL